MSHEKTMAERSAVYGEFAKGLWAEAQIMQVLLGFHRDTHGTELDILSQQYIQKIVMKLTRVAVSPTHIDSWHDISNYAKLTEEAIKNAPAIAAAVGAARTTVREGSSSQP